MQFLIDADLPRSLVALSNIHGHDGLHVDQTSLAGAGDPDIARFARDRERCLVTGDFGFADVRNFPPARYHGIVVLELPPHATAKSIRRLFADLLQRPEILRKLAGRLAIVAPGRVRLRPK